MEAYIIAIIVIGVLALCIIAYFLYKRLNKKKPVSMEHDYVWLGQGEHPFKRKKVRIKF